MLSFAWGFLLSLHMGMGLSSPGRLYSPEELTLSRSHTPGLWLLHNVLGSSGN